MRPSRTLVLALPLCALALVGLLLLWAQDPPAPTEPEVLPERGVAERELAVDAPETAAARAAAGLGAGTTTPGGPHANGDAAQRVRVHGRVLGSDRQPSPAAALWVLEPDPAGTHNPTAHARTLTDVEGRFECWLEAPGEFLLLAVGAAQGEARVPHSVPPGVTDSDAGELVLPAGGTIRGRVLDPAGLERRALVVEARAQGELVWSADIAGHHADVGFRRVRVDAQGRFELTGLRQVPHDVQLAEHCNSWFEPARFDGVLPGGEELIFRRQIHGTLRGRVVDALTQQPITHFRVQEEERRDEHGRFEVAYVREYGVLVSAPGYLGDFWVPGPDVALGGTTEAEIALQRMAPAGTLRVRARDERGQPVVGLRLRDEHRLPLWNSVVEATPGLVVASALPLGRRSLLIDAPGHALRPVWAIVRENETTEQEVVLERGARAQLTVYDDRGLLARDYGFEIDMQRRKERDLNWLPAGGDFDYPGHFELGLITNTGEVKRYGLLDGFVSGLPAGEYELVVHVDAERRETFAFTIDATEERAFVFRVPRR